MVVNQASLLFGSGVVGGAASALIGGATFFTFPALLSCGIPAVLANASNSVALLPGSFVAAFADRQFRPPLNKSSFKLVLAAVLGAAAGALLLEATPEGAFRRIVPILIGVAALLFYYADRIRAWIIVRQKRSNGSDRFASLSSFFLVLVISIYGSYFGAGLGVLLMAALQAVLGGEFRAVNALKNMLAGVISVVAVILFSSHGLVVWEPTFLVMAGACIGALLGVSIARVAPTQVLRKFVLAVSVGLTLWYAWNGWIAR